MQEDEQRLRDLQNRIIKQEEIKAPTAEDLEVFRNQLRIQVEGELDMDTKKSVLNSLIKKLKVDQDGLVEIDFCVALGNTPYTSYLLRRFEWIKSVFLIYIWLPFKKRHSNSYWITGDFLMGTSQNTKGKSMSILA